MSLLLLETDSSSSNEDDTPTKTIQGDQVSHIQSYLDHHDGIAPKNAFKLINYCKTQTDLKDLSYAQAREAIDKYNHTYIESNEPDREPKQNMVKNSKKQVSQHCEKLLDDDVIIPVPLCLVSRQTGASFDHNISEYTPFDMLLLYSSFVFCIVWIAEIIFCLIVFGISSNYCNEDTTSCNKGIKPDCCADYLQKNDRYNLLHTQGCYTGDIGSFSCHAAGYCYDSTPCDNYYVVPCCAEQYKNECFYSNELNQCSNGKSTVAPFVMQVVLIACILFYLFLCHKALKRKGIIIDEQKAVSDPGGKCRFCKRIIKKILACKEKLESKRIDCRDMAKESVYQKNPIELFSDALIIKAVFNAVKDLPIIFWNYFSGGALVYTATAMLITNALIIVDRIMCRKCYQRLARCQCKTCDPTPKQHVEYVNMTNRILRRSFNFSFVAAFSQLSAVLIEDSFTEAHAWLICLNFVMGAHKIVSLLKLGWDYSILISYWQRDSVNKRECQRMNKILESLFVAVLFKISITENDKFITVKHQATAKMLYENNVVYFLKFVMVIYLFVVAFVLICCTYILNEKNFNE